MAARMEIILTKGEREDLIAAVRADGSRIETRFPHKGPMAHDAVHFFVEQRLALKRGFWGTVADGTHPEAVAEMSKLGGHASASRAGIPDASIVELLQAERIVECFEADLWSGSSGDPAGLIEFARVACGYSHVDLPPCDEAAMFDIQCDVAAFARDWSAAPVNHVATLCWPD